MIKYKADISQFERSMQSGLLIVDIEKQYSGTIMFA